MGVYGPYTAVAGTVQQCAVDPDAQAVYISNTTIYDLYTAASPIAPPATSAFGGWPWIRRIPQGDRAGVQLPLERYAGAGFPGYLFVLPQPAVSGYVLTGQTPSSSLFTIEGYADPSAMPPDCASPQFQAASSQQRVIDVPIVEYYPNGFRTAGIAVTGTGKATLMASGVYDVSSFASQQVWVIIYHASIYSLPGTTGGSWEFSFQFDVLTSGGASVGFPFPYTVRNGVISWGASNGPGTNWNMLAEGPWPHATPISIPASGKWLAWYAQGLAGVGTTNSIVADWNFELEQLISGGSLWIPRGIGNPNNNGVLF